MAQTLFASLVQDYEGARRSEDRRRANDRAVGDAEMDEGNIFEALLEVKRLAQHLWIVDYNRQSLDAVVREGLWEKFDPCSATSLTW